MMSVEKRYSKRRELTCDVYIRYRKQRAFPASARNCSLYGMYLKTQNLTLLTGALVELDFHYDNRHWQISGLVTHTNKDGLGVMFWDEQPELYKIVTAHALPISNDQLGGLFTLPIDSSFIEDSV